jgi:predicted dehydrogenase
MSSAKVLVGIVGFGNMGRLHAEQLRYLPDVTVSVIVDSLEKNRADAAALYRDAEVEIFNDVVEAIVATNVRAWVVASSTDTHIDMAEELLRRDCTVLLEKPIAPSLREAERIRSLVHPDSANLMMGHILLWHREFRALQGLLSELGKIVAISASRQRSRDHQIRYPKESPFSLTMVHDLYSVFALLGGALPLALAAQHRKNSQGEVDCALAQVFWPESVVASFQANFLIPDGVPGGGTSDELQVIGENGLLRLSYESGHLTHLVSGQARRVELPRPAGAGLANFFDDALRSELENFVAVVRNQAQVPIGARYEDACQIHKWIESFEKSAESGVVQQC